MTQLYSLNQAQPPSLATLLRPVAVESETVTLTDWLPLAEAQVTPLALQPASMVLAQQFDQDILGDMTNAWNHFIQSGQVWALVIGIIIGYLIRNLTAY